jgi:hypothetical protein
MEKTELTFDERCNFNGGPRLISGGEFPTIDVDRKIKMVPTVHCSNLVALTETAGGKTVGVLCMFNPDRSAGLIAAYSAERIRQLAKSFEAMADHIDAENEKSK